MTYFNFKCNIENCSRYKTDDCQRCKHNTRRNSFVDNFEACEDKDIRELRCRNGKYSTHLVGSAEQGGLRCPACGYLNNAYTFEEDTNCECDSCGLPLTCKR